jgi:hypothetical protein
MPPPQIDISPIFPKCDTRAQDNFAGRELTAVPDIPPARHAG